MNLRDRYKKETGEDAMIGEVRAVIDGDATNEYVEWLENLIESNI